ncbi:MAG: dTDP-4-amino-4,6-dideoxygalactose transaminase [Saprospirales bacterium]|nr:dTDP-4-amino-4,6-dideoxygalactose transaminase [Saprospirales bacterium]
MKPIPFHFPYLSGEEKKTIQKAIKHFGAGRKDSPYLARCEQWLQKFCQVERVLLTTSCTHALELAALLCNIGPGDEVILPSFTFVSTANAFALRGARLCFVDIDPHTMNIDPVRVEAAITPQTKAIVVVHYGGVSCNIAALRQLADRFNIFLIEDAAHCINAYCEEAHLGTFGHLGSFSFHKTKNINSREGGALVVNDPALMDRAAIIRDNGTNREAFFSGKVSHYEWVDIGSNYHMTELSAAFLWPQLKNAKEVTRKLLVHWNAYYEALLPLWEENKIELCAVPPYARHNAHLSFIKCRDLEERTALIAFLKDRGIDAFFHYIPLHNTPAGKRYGYFAGSDQHTTFESERLLRLPLYYELKKSQRKRVVKVLYEFYRPQR